jgi:hypothetical protein
MASQTLIFVLLPNGITAQKKLRLSIYVTPRLDQGATLAAFPDILQWTSLVKTHGLKFEIACAGKKTTVSADQAVLRPDIWQAIFTPTTFVEKYSIPDFDQRLIVSYPVRGAMSYFKYAYQTIGAASQTAQERNPLEIVLGSLMYRSEGGESTLAQEIADMRVTMWREQQGSLAPGGGGIVVLTVTEGIKAPAPPDGVPTTLMEPTDNHSTMTRFAMFHSMPPAPNRPALPQTEADFAKVLDFHRALTALNSYPSLLRALGLVFDVELPESFCPQSPAAGAYGSIQLSKVTPGFKWSLKPVFSFPITSYVKDQHSFGAAPASPAGSTSYFAGDVVNGFLALSGQDFHLLQVDVDGGLLKALTVADNLANASDPARVGDALPSLRSGGIGLVAEGRGLQLLQSIVANKGFDDALNNSTALPRPLNARDLVRGFRIDIWSSRKRQWYSLHRRNSVYHFGPTGAIALPIDDEEGFLQPAAAQPADDPTRTPDPTATSNGIPQPATDLYVHERLARWDGWSLSASRPGLALNRSPDPSLATDPDPTMNQPLTPFKMTTSFAAAAGSLPELRFGVNYRLRARAVDLAGNSLPLSAAAPGNLVLPAGGANLPYLRFEPVNTPLLVLQQPTQPGGSLEHMVIRSWNTDPSLDGVPTAETDHRHVAPPRIALRMAEHHGLLDDANGRLKGDPATFAMLAARDSFQFPQQDGVPMDPSPLVTVGYLPDLLARGAAFRNLPQAPDNANGRLTANTLVYKTLPDAQPRPGSVTFIDFGTSWPQRTPFLLAIAEGNAPPQWNASSSMLTVSLPKAMATDVELSSYLQEPDLTIMGVWTWLREYFTAAEINAMQNGSANSSVTFASDIIALMTRLVLEGGHAMLTPSRTVSLVHAVLQPLGRPHFVQLPVIHHPASPINASALRNSFTPITAWRSTGSHYAALLGALEIHAVSTSKIDLEARWLEYVDDPTQPAPTKSWHSGHVETIPLPGTDAVPLFSDATNTRMVASYIPRVDTLWFSVPIDVLEGVTTPSDVAAPLHRFDDTKHRWVGYTAIATSRFQEYFPAGLDVTRSSDALVVDVPSSARPVAPDVAYVVPTFGWERQETTNVKSSVRFGNGVRVYLRRSWYSSGDGELLGAVLWNGAAPDYATREQYKALFTQWGNDPIWQTGFLPDVPAISHFPNAVASASGLVVEESPKIFDVAGHAVQYDPQRRLWYCDIEFYNAVSYMPFVRLALARYQPHSIQNVELSRIVLADYVQLAPDRSAIVSIDPADSRRAQIFVGGVAPQPPAQSVIEVTVQQRLAHAVSDLAWEQAPASVVKVQENAPDASEPDAVLWSGSVVFSKTPPPGQFRIVVREFERIQIDDPLVLRPLAQAALPPIGIQHYGERMVYVAIIPYDYPARG